MLRIILNLCLGISLLIITLACSDARPESDVLVAQLSQKYGVDLVALTATDQLPRSVVYKLDNQEIEVQLSAPTQAQFSRYLTIVSKALKKYPPALVNKHLGQILIGDQYRENGGIITGMYEDNCLFLFYNHEDGDNSDIFLEQTIHHEFSSVLIKYYDFPAFDWLKLNLKDFNYIINPDKIRAYMNSVQSYGADETLLNQGLISSYGKANAENDINTYVELIFTQPEKMKGYVERYPRVRLKYGMIKAFYLAVSSDFGDLFNY